MRIRASSFHLITGEPMTTHSPAPWHSEDNRTISDADGCYVAVVPPTFLHGKDISPANRSLILAAPAMLDVLKNISECKLLECNCGGTCDGTCTYVLVENAIKAATQVDGAVPA